MVSLVAESISSSCEIHKIENIIKGECYREDGGYRSSFEAKDECSVLFQTFEANARNQEEGSIQIHKKRGRSYAKLKTLLENI